jgi:hypothetical protein
MRPTAHVLTLFTVLATAACGGDNQVTPTPDTSGSSSSSGAGGAGGGGGGGAGGEGAGTPAAESGSRLTAQWFVGADGSRQFKGMYDTLLDVECIPREVTPGGEWRCLPKAAGGLSLFGDAACTQRLWAVSGCSPSIPSMVTLQPVEEQCNALETYDVFNEFVGQAYAGGPSNCSLSPFSNVTTYSLAARPISDFLVVAVE